MKKYKSYKNSGVEWIGEIPSHWEVRRLGSLGKFLKGSNVSKDKLSKNGLEVILYGDIYTKYNIKTFYFNRFITEEIAKNSTKVLKNDLLLTGSGELKEEIGKCIVYLGNNLAYAGGDVIIFRQNQNNSLFMSYVLNSNLAIFQKILIAKGEIIVHIYSSKLKELKIPLPPLPEQQKIATYLDNKIEKIQKAISKKEKLINLLKEQKQVIINEAVTKGIDKNVEYKDSGVEWIGEIPSHWEVRKIGQKFLERKDKVSDKVYQPLSVTKNGIVPQLENAAKTKDGDNRKLVKKGDFVINSRSDRKGSSGVSLLDGSVSLINIVLKPVDIEINYCNYLLKSNGFIEEFYRNGHGIVADLWTTRYWDMKNILLPFPPLPEQQKIVSYIEEKISKIDNLIQLQQKQIEKLKEYKTTLIDEVVTGKIKVFDE